MGRVKSYNEESVIESALNCFWTNGYKNTSIRQLEQEMGINQFSIYSSFKSKFQLYERVLIKYTSLLEDAYLKNLSKEDCTIKDVERFLIKFGTDMIKGKIPGSCLMIRSIINYDSFSKQIQKRIDLFIKSMTTHFDRALRNSKNLGAINSSTSIDKEVNYLLGITQSVSVMYQHMSSKDFKAYIKNSISKIE